MAKNDFDPVKEERDGVKARRVIWSTKALNAALKGLDEGRRLVANPFYDNNPRLLKRDLVFKHTKEELEEWQRCCDDIIYFANTYCKLMTPEGIKKITLRDYQEDYLRHLVEHDMSVMLSPRQAGKTTTSSIFILHFVLFNIEKNVLILGNKFRTSKDILDKFKEIYYQLPFFLKSGVIKWNEAEVCLDSGCKIKAEATTEKSGIGMSISLALLDEFGHVAPNIIDKFYNNLLPVISATKGRVIITSTQNGYNLFYRIWMAAKQHLNDYWPFEVTWDMIPEWNPDKKCWEKRDEAWHQRQIANYGSEEAFNQQFGTDFDVNANTLIDSKILKKKQHSAIEFINKDLYGVSNSQYFFWKPDYEPMEDLCKDFITVTIDIAEGGGGDFTIFNFNRMTEKGDETIGFFRANTVNIEQATLTLMEIATKYLHPDHHCISLEYNTYGELFVKCIRENRDKYPHVSSFDESNFVKYYNEAMTSYRIGIKLTSATKSVGCKLFKEQYEKGIIENQSTIFLAEMENFSDSKGNDTYAATFGHDDEVMASIQLVHAKQSNAYKYLRSEFDSYKPDKETGKELLPGVSQNEVDKMNAGEYFDPTKVFPSFNSMDDIYNSISQRNSNPYASDLSRLSRFS